MSRKIQLLVPFVYFIFYILCRVLSKDIVQPVVGQTMLCKLVGTVKVLA